MLWVGLLQVPCAGDIFACCCMQDGPLSEGNLNFASHYACVLMQALERGFLSEQYLSSVQAAEAITKELLAVYAAAGVIPWLRRLSKVIRTWFTF